jgi:hypothetical protein
LTVCPTCEGRLRKVFAAVGVVFKGSGFYRNDSRESAKSGAGDAAKSSGGEAAARLVGLLIRVGIVGLERVILGLVGDVEAGAVLSSRVIPADRRQAGQ